MKKIFGFTLGLIISINSIIYGGAILWGVTDGTGNWDFNNGGKIFTVDVDTGEVTTHALYTAQGDSVYRFGDIAIRSNGEMYVTYYDGRPDGLDKLAKVNTTTWEFDWVQDLGDQFKQVNALTFVGDTLYGLTGARAGGGFLTEVLRFNLTSTGATITDLGLIRPFAQSDGDLAVDPVTGQVYFTGATGSGMWPPGQLFTLALDTSPTATLLGPDSDMPFLDGLEFTYDGRLWAGRAGYAAKTTELYAVDKTTGQLTLAYDLSSKLGADITGLSIPAIPAPGAIILGCLGIGFVSWLRKRKVL